MSDSNWKTYGQIPKQPKPHENTQNQGNVMKNKKQLRKKWPPTNYQTILNITKNSIVGGPGDGCGFVIWPYQMRLHVC